jgi:hypothetical protein
MGRRSSRSLRQVCALTALHVVQLVLVGCATPPTPEEPTPWRIRSLAESVEYSIDRRTGADPGDYRSVTLEGTVKQEGLGIEVGHNFGRLPLYAKFTSAQLSDAGGVDSDQGFRLALGTTPRVAQVGNWAVTADAFVGTLQAAVRANGTTTSLPIRSDIRSVEAGFGLDVHYVPNSDAAFAIAPFLGAHYLYGDGVQDYSSGNSSELDYGAAYGKAGIECNWQSESGFTVGTRLSLLVGEVEGFQLSLEARF